jgi:predicted HicB family RNase H-like nuclease
MAYENMDEVLLIRIDSDLKRRIKKAARVQERSISNYVRWVMRRELDKEGITVEPRTRKPRV